MSNLKLFTAVVLIITISLLVLAQHISVAAATEEKQQQEKEKEFVAEQDDNKNKEASSPSSTSSATTTNNNNKDKDKQKETQQQPLTAKKVCVPFSSLKHLEFRAGEKTTTRRRTSNRPTMACRPGFYCPSEISPLSAKCNQLIAVDEKEKFPYFKCLGEFSAPSLPPEYEHRFGEIHVDCEGCDRAGDTNVIENSCQLQYTIESRNSLTAKDENADRSAAMWTIFGAAAASSSFWNFSEETEIMLLVFGIFGFVVAVIGSILWCTSCCKDCPQGGGGGGSYSSSSNYNSSSSYSSSSRSGGYTSSSSYSSGGGGGSSSSGRSSWSSGGGVGHSSSS